MVVCKYFLQGNCRFGDNCKFEHPGSRNSGFANQNRFTALQNPPSRSGSGSDGRKDTAWSINPTDVRNDLTAGTGRPQWILTAYGPGRGPPASLLEENEFSPEELRVRFYDMASKGSQDVADQEAVSLWTRAEQQIAAIANKSEDVIQFMEDASRKHPNRYDFCKVDGSKTVEQVAKEAESGSSPFGASPGFGASGGFGQTPSAGSTFGKPPLTSFNQQSASSGFGSTGFGQTAQPSAFSQPASATAFGKPAFGSSGFGQTPAFGQPAKPASTFGQPAQPTSIFGQGTQPRSTFGQPATATASAFGQPVQSSAFGQPAQPSSFGQPAQASPFGQPAQPSTFGQPAPAFGQPAPAPAFGSSGFGAGAAKNPFAAPSASSTFGQASQPTSTFGQPAQPTSSFGQSSTASAFGKPAAFGSGSAFGKPPLSAFGQQPQANTSPFGQQAQSAASPFGQPAALNSFSSGSLPGSGITPAANNPFEQSSSKAADVDHEMAAIPSINTFGQPTPAANSVFGQPVQPSMTTTNPFGAQAATILPTPFGSIPPNTQALPPTRTSSFVPNIASSSDPHPLTNKPPHPVHYTQTLPNNAPAKFDASQKLTSYRGLPVKYVGDTAVYDRDRNGEVHLRYVSDIPCYERPDRRGLERVWFPQGGATPEVKALTSRAEKLDELQAPDDKYTDEVTELWKGLYEMGRFEAGRMPLVPPRRDWCVYDF